MGFGNRDLLFRCDGGIEIPKEFTHPKLRNFSELRLTPSGLQRNRLEIIAGLDAEITMTSIEMVTYLNDERKNSPTAYAEVNHSDFMRRVPKVLGEDHVPKFLGSQSYGNNNTRDIYNFPKREACLMAMSYSHELQAKFCHKNV